MKFSYLILGMANVMMASNLSVLADVQYTQEMKMDGKTFSKITNSFRKGAQRTESSFQMGPVEQRSVTLTLCATKQMVTLDPNLKIYYVTPLVSASKSAEGTQTPAKTGTAKTGTMTTTLVSLTELGPEKVGEFDARGYEIVTRMQTAGCMGNSDTTFKQQVFVAPGVDISTDGGCNDAVPAMGANRGSDGCNVSYVRKGDWAAYEKVMRSLPVKTRIFTSAADTKAQSEMATTQVSRAPLPESLFSVPTDFKKVSQTEFQTAQTRAMMEKMTGGANAATGDEDNDTDEDE
ncbi:MAG TPA: hypothetical protein VGB45_08840 [Abditibacterium sp.]